MNRDELCYAPILVLRELLARRAVSARELVEALIDRLEEVNPSLNAVVALRPEAALAEAQSLDRDSSTRGPLAGIPFTIKDLNETADLPTTMGSRAFAGHQAGFDAEVVRRLRQAGAILLGKTNTPEFGLRATTENQLFGTTRNPWNLGYNPGGSSGGAAAAVAAGISPLAQGSDGGGSIRNPASSCGVVGLKPTRGRVSGAPAAYEAWAGLATDGPLARTIRDVALMLDVIAGPVAGEPYGLPQAMPFLAACDRRPSKLRLAYTALPAHGQIHSEVKDALVRVVRTFREMGHEVEEASPDLTGLRAAFITIVGGNVGALKKRVPPEKLGDLEPSTVNLMLSGHSLTAADYCEAVNTARTRAAAIMGFWREYDFLLTPTMTQLPPLLGAMPSSFELDAIWDEITDLGAFTYPFNVTGQPSLSVPAGWSIEHKLPIGVQIVGEYGSESELLALAACYEEAQPWIDRRPQLHPSGMASTTQG
ncbi:MAG: amidase [Candidatus Nephthysia bennettiae]|uniref:Amidase n=1 Tax=Candidatus Nephthysia bennettiae TaxID=3127016 RepID=A0A934NC66_9BACT|nr:amidase [Candidatus Dormibacteraeota bacterium]MBJ7613642.1 amidase [Candidatus Dormibacteraeota bacterium]PZS00149.1 MAG: amidase [Candidatus Dormibacteraeota bacterium]